MVKILCDIQGWAWQLWFKVWWAAWGRGSAAVARAGEDTTITIAMPRLTVPANSTAYKIPANSTANTVPANFTAYSTRQRHSTGKLSNATPQLKRMDDPRPSSIINVSRKAMSSSTRVRHGDELQPLHKK